MICLKRIGASWNWIENINKIIITPNPPPPHQKNPPTTTSTKPNIASFGVRLIIFINDAWVSKYYDTKHDLLCVDGPDNPVLNTTGTLDVTEYDATPYFACQSNCNPPCNYKLSRGGSTSSSNYSSTGIFYFSTVRKIDGGDYKCIANNTVDTKTSNGSFRLNVQCKTFYFTAHALSVICYKRLYLGLNYSQTCEIIKGIFIDTC